METPFEKVLMNFYKEQMMAYMDAHPEAFEEAIQLAIGDKQPYSWRSAWLLWSCLEENDHRVKPHINKIIESIEGKKDGHQRELVKILSTMELDEEQEGKVFNICMNLWEKIGKDPSVRMIAFRFIIKTAKKYPELANEIVLLTQDQYMESLSPGVKRALQKLIKEL